MLSGYFFLPFAVLSSALPSYIRDTTCSEPTTFTVRDLGIFTPSSSNTGPSRISFEVDNTTCSSNTILNPKNATACADTHYSYFWDGSSLTVQQVYTPCDNPTGLALVKGTISDIALDCIPVESPYPLGDGTLCQTPTGELSGEY